MYSFARFVPSIQLLITDYIHTITDNSTAYKSHTRNIRRKIANLENQSIIQ